MRYIGVGTFKATPRMTSLVNEVLESGQLTYGKMCREFEHSFAAQHSCKFAVLSNSGTSSLQVALQAMRELYGWHEYDEVIIPAVTFVATANIVIHNNMRPVLVDVDPRTYNIDPTLIRAAITSRTRAIIPVHLMGQPAEMTAIVKLAREFNLKIIEDSCECVGVHHHRWSVGSMGHVGCFSTYAAHIITTGVGGLATTNDPRLAAKMRSLVNHGRDGIYIATTDDDGKEGTELREIIHRRFNFESVGHSFRVTEMEAAIGLAQMDDLARIYDRRNRNAEMLTRGLLDLHQEGLIQLPEKLAHNTHAWMNYAIIMLRDQDKWPICEYLENCGIETRELVRLSDQPAYGGAWRESDYPVAAWINRRGFYIGCHQNLVTSDIAYVLDRFHDYFRNSR